ncbi:MAG: hypothetical protein F6J87_13780 [Spirulina sp. SIO3F2]|nr:hypothetical protein [Spirulina sp. SIO3F2]
MHRHDFNTIDRQLFFTELSRLYIQAEKLTIAMLFLSNRWMREYRLSQEQRNLLIAPGWDCFTHSFSLSGQFTRWGWTKYIGLITANDFSEILAEFRTVVSGCFNVDQNRFWRVALLQLDGFDRVNNACHPLLVDFESALSSFDSYYSSESDRLYWVTNTDQKDSIFYLEVTEVS